jgi:glycosyltransferase involved in cell wall biosynthesis
MSKLIVMLRVKNGIFFLKDWLNCFEKIVDEIVVLDNGSTDGTLEMLRKHPKVTDIAETAGYNEGRDKNMMYNAARRRKPDWCIWLDVDEIFEPGLTRAHFDRLMSSGFINKFGFRRFHFIDSQHFAASRYRLNYSSGHDRVMWRESPSGYFEDIIIDSPNVKGIRGLIWPTNFRLKHTGYINKEIVDQKATLYRSIIPAKEETFKKMYLQNEKGMRWSDDRSSFGVRKLNLVLSAMQLYNLFPRIYWKVNRMVKKRMAGLPNPKITESQTKVLADKYE